MFIEINGTNYNMYSISSFRKSIQNVESQSGSVVTRYLITYVLNSGDAIMEIFNTQAEQLERYDYIISRFGMDTNQNNQ